MDRYRQTRIAGIRTPLNAPLAAPVLVGYSGGMDSHVLLHLLAGDARIRARGLRAIHVHHGLHAQADHWAAHCRTVCQALNMPLHIERVHVTDTQGEGLEGAARRARYVAFEAHLQAGEILALAQHRDDQAETFLLRALRASSIDGLAAMQAWRPHAQGWLWRPLLGYGRTDLLAYARAQGLRWIDDPSNATCDAERNFLRNNVMPLLRERWPHADAALARSAELSGEAAHLLRARDDVLLREATSQNAPHRLTIAAITRLTATQRARVLRAWIQTLAFAPLPSSGIAAIEQQVLSACADSQACFAWRDVRIVHWRGQLHALRGTPPALAADWSVQWDGREPLALPTGDTLLLDGASAFDAPVCVHARRGGERITLPQRTHSHALKHVLQENGIPPWERAAMPLLSSIEGVLLAAGEIASASLQAWLNANNAHLRWLRGNT